MFSRNDKQIQEAARHIRTKTKQQAVQHATIIYKKSSCTKRFLTSSTQRHRHENGHNLKTNCINHFRRLPSDDVVNFAKTYGLEVKLVSLNPINPSLNSYQMSLSSFARSEGHRNSSTIVTQSIFKDSQKRSILRISFCPCLYEVY